MRQRPPAGGPADHRLVLLAPVRAAAGLAPAGRRWGERGRTARPFSLADVIPGMTKANKTARTPMTTSISTSEKQLHLLSVFIATPSIL